jgi:hypothetical protein
VTKIGGFSYNTAEKKKREIGGKYREIKVNINNFSFPS